MSADKQYVYFFGDGKADGNATMRDLLGGKGANLAEMSRIGLPVPPGLTLTTEVCVEFYKNNRQYPAPLKSQVEAGMKKVEQVMGKKFGCKENPLLMSCRSGARESMPGMMDTVLNIVSTTKPSRHLPRPPATNASPGTLTAASFRCTVTSFWK